MLVLEVDALVSGKKHSRHRWRDTATRTLESRLNAALAGVGRLLAETCIVLADAARRDANRRAAVDAAAHRKRIDAIQRALDEDLDDRARTLLAVERMRGLLNGPAGEAFVARRGAWLKWSSWASRRLNEIEADVMQRALPADAEWFLESEIDA